MQRHARLCNNKAWDSCFITHPHDAVVMDSFSVRPSTSEKLQMQRGTRRKIYKQSGKVDATLVFKM